MADEGHAQKHTACLRINQLYCEKHGYEFHAQLPALPTPGVGYGSNGEAYHPSYQKPYILLENLHKVDYAIWIDIDAVFVNHEKKIEDVINLAPDRDIIYFDDLLGAVPLNAGVFIAKNTSYAHFILWKWWEWCRTMKNTEARSVLNWDQGILIETLNQIGHKIDALPSSLMNQHPARFKSGELLIHWMGYWPESHSEHMKFLIEHLDNSNFVGKYVEILAKVTDKAEHGAPCKTVSVDSIIEQIS